MKIDKQRLIELLVNKTGMEKKEIEEQLDHLIKRILDAANQGKALEIKEFGLFYFNEFGELKFDPSDKLSTEISFKYAGMKPVEIEPDRNSSIIITEDDAELDDIFENQPDTTQDITDDSVDDIDKLFIEHNKTNKPIRVELDDDFFDKELTDDDDDVFDLLTDLPEEPKTKKAASKVKKKAKLSTSKPKLKRTPRLRQSNTGIWVIVAFLLIALIAAVLYLWMSGSSTTTQQQAVVTPQAQPGTQELPDITDDITQPGNNNEMEPVPESTVQLPDPAPVTQPGTQSVPSDQPFYGLMGEINLEAVNSYGIVLHSFNEEAIARNTANQLRMEEGYRTQVTARTVSNRIMWRVSVGQFESLGDAQAAATRLPEPYNNQNFIHRIQNN